MTYERNRLPTSLADEDTETIQLELSRRVAVSAEAHRLASMHSSLCYAVARFLAGLPVEERQRIMDLAQKRADEDAQRR